MGVDVCSASAVAYMWCGREGAREKRKGTQADEQGEHKKDDSQGTVSHTCFLAVRNLSRRCHRRVTPRIELSRKRTMFSVRVWCVGGVGVWCGCVVCGCGVCVCGMGVCLLFFLSLFLSLPLVLPLPHATSRVV